MAETDTDFETRLRQIERKRSNGRTAWKSTKVDADGRFYLVNRGRRGGFPLTGFIFTMMVLWCAKALMLVQNASGFYMPEDVTLDIQQPLQTFWSLVMYPDPVTVRLAEAISAIAA